MKLELDNWEYIDDKTGKTIIRFTPVLRGNLVATGELRFAFWEAWANDTDAALEQAKKHAIDNARRVLLESARTR